MVRVYSDTASGARSDRAALAAVLVGAHRREFDVLLIWALDRLSREGIASMTGYMEQLQRAGVRVLSRGSLPAPAADPGHAREGPLC